MKIKLEDISKKNIYEVPEGYFEKLPGIIQARVSQQGRGAAETRPFFMFTALKYAAPAILLAIAIIYWLKPGMKEQSAEDILATVETEHLVEYLAESGLTTDELFDAIDFSEADVTDIENAVYFDFSIPDDNSEDLELLLEEYLDPEDSVVG